MNKSELRKLYLEKRASLSGSEVLEFSQRIAERFFESVNLTDLKLFHTFIPIRKFNEIDTSEIFEKVWRDRPEIVTVAPRTDLLSGGLENVVFDRSTQWTENDWGICEPIGGEVVDVEKIDLVIVPLLCFDETGHRVGYGKGIYDRFLAGCRTDCVKVGISFFSPLICIVDTVETDVRLDMCITPEDVYKYKRMRR